MSAGAFFTTIRISLQVTSFVMGPIMNFHMLYDSYKFKAETV